MHTGLASNQAFSWEWLDILYLLRLALVPKLERWRKHHVIFYKGCEKSRFADLIFKFP